MHFYSRHPPQVVADAFFFLPDLPEIKATPQHRADITAEKAPDKVFI